MVGAQIGAMGEVATPTPISSAVKCEPSTATAVPKRKKKKPSAIRDFPLGCGRYAAPITLNSIPIPTPTPLANEEEEQQISALKQPEKSAPPHSPLPTAHVDEKQQQYSMHVETSTHSPPSSPAHEEQQHLSIAKHPENPSSLRPPAARDQEQQMSIGMEVEDGIIMPSVASPLVLPATAEIPMCPPASTKSDTAKFPTRSVCAVRGFPLCSTSPETPMCPLLTQPASPSTAPIKFPKRFVSVVRDFPFGCGRNAPPTTREECLRAVAALKASKTPTKHQPITPPPLSLQQAEISSALDAETAENQLDLIPKDSEATPTPASEDSEATPTPPSEEPGKRPDEDKNLPEEKALMVSTDQNPEISQGSKVNDKIANSGTDSKMKASNTSKGPCSGPQEKMDLPDGQSLMVSTDCLRSHPELESSKTSKVNHKTANCETTVLKHKKKASSSQKQKHKVESGNFADSQSNKVDDQLDLAPKGSKESPKFDISDVKEVEENLPSGQTLIESSPNSLQSRSNPKRSQNSRAKVNTDNGGTLVNMSKNKSQYKSKPKFQSANFALTPFDSADGQTRSDGDGMVTRAKVRETMRLFQVLYRKFLQGEENHPKQPGQGPRRPDIMAATVLKEKNKYLNTGKKIVGNVPGVEVGDEFHYRIELMIVGLHGQSQGGIDYLKQGNTIIATSIVASGGYADNDEGEVLTYSGQGGNMDKKGKQTEDQKLERGNLALKNCIAAGSPVRVIRGFKDSRNSSGARGGKDGTMSKTGITYTYDGLYLVESYQQEMGANGFSVFKFQLRRMSGQPELAWNIVKSVGRSKKGAPREGLCLQDISQGKETRPICVVNTVDDEAGPAPFEYTAKIIYPSGFNPPSPRSCDCVDGCSDSERCLCAVKNGGELPYNYNGSIVEAKSIVYECSPSCKCPPTCHNRVSQHGVRINLEIFKTDKRGWGVRSLSSISSGSFICEYTGELLSDMEAEQRTGNDEYLFDIGRSSDQSLWDGLSGLVNELPSHSISETVEDAGYTIDAAKYGSVGRFINHSCSPNLYAQNVLYDHDDKNIPHIMLFAAENIPPLQELCYHYNYNPDSVRDSDGNIKKKSCYCGSAECTGRLY